MCQPESIHRLIELNSISEPAIQEQNNAQTAIYLPENQVTLNPNLQKRTRRQFTTEYKLKILAEPDACQHGEVGKLLRREKLFIS